MFDFPGTSIMEMTPNNISILVQLLPFTLLFFGFSFVAIIPLCCLTVEKGELATRRIAILTVEQPDTDCFRLTLSCSNYSYKHRPPPVGLRSS